MDGHNTQINFPYACVRCGTMVLNGIKCSGCEGTKKDSTIIIVMRDKNTGLISSVTEEWVH